MVLFASTATGTTRATEGDETFVDVWDEMVNNFTGDHKKKGFYDSWIDHSSAKYSSPGLFAFEALRKLYPNHSVVSTTDFRLDLLNFPAAEWTPLENNPLITIIGFVSLARNSSPTPGVLAERVLAGGFTVKWQGFEFILQIIQYPSGFGTLTHTFILHQGPEDPARSLLLAAGLWSEALHDEIWVFNQGFWQKDAGLWQAIQKADWKDVILKDDFKTALQKDVYGFFESEELYKDLGIPWKRGLILHGPPGNGKTISLKTIMKTCDAKGYVPLYVKSFQSYLGDEYSMELVFGKARQLAPCVIILEDIDSLINDRNRSFFLNQLDGLEGNDGLLIIGTTNHFDRLDPGLSTRPSRFDRKYKFDDPDRDERALYATYWQKKLEGKKSLSFPDDLVEEVADATDKFSFAYLKEAFVSALVSLAGYEDSDDKPSLRSVLMEQIDLLRKQLDKASIMNTSHQSQFRTHRHFVPPQPLATAPSMFDLPQGQRQARPLPSIALQPPTFAGLECLPQLAQVVPTRSNVPNVDGRILCSTTPATLLASPANPPVRQSLNRFQNPSDDDFSTLADRLNALRSPTDDRGLEIIRSSKAIYQNNTMWRQ